MSLDSLITQWLQIDINPTTRAEILSLQASGDYKTLSSKLSTRISFGTAGLRSEMSAGFAHMNDVTVLQASQGLVQYILDQKNPSIVVGHDHRHNSQRFAEIVASAALLRGVKVYYLGDPESLSKETIDKSDGSKPQSSVCHTPLVPFAIDYYSASAGVMITASHNPAKDNGYKVYYGNGCQIIPPHDEGIASSIDRNLDPWENAWNVGENMAQGLKTGMLVSSREKMVDEYVRVTREKLVTSPKLSFDFVYTPIHGVGYEITHKCLSNAFTGYSMKVVEQQQHPDPDFPTVQFPNPEEKGALDLAIATAEAQGVSLVVANDPDADRFSVAVKTRAGKWRQLTGNEIGFLFAMYVVEELGETNNVWLLNSTVSSQVLRSVAEKNGCKFQDTLTGFKWIGNKAIDLKKDGASVPFAYEEAIGFMFGVVNDKDGVSAAMVWLQLYEKWFADGQVDPVEKLAQGYAKYGWFKECNGYYKLNDLGKTKEIFDGVRSSYEGDHPTNIGDFTVVSWRDLTVGYETGTPDGVPTLPVDPKSQMITAVLKKGEGSVRFTCRGSGTEPKLKVYVEGMGGQEGVAVDIARECWEVLRGEWFRPEENGLMEVV